MGENSVNTAKVEVLEKQIEEIKFKPAEDYSKIKRAIITSICTGIIGVILGLIFSEK